MGGGWTVDGWIDGRGPQGPAPPCLPRDARDRCLEAQEPPALRTGAHVPTAQLLPAPPVAGGDRVHHHPLQLHVQQQLCRGHEPAAHPHHHHPGDTGVSLPDAGVGEGSGQGLGPVLLGGLLGRQGGHEQGEVQALEASLGRGPAGHMLGGAAGAGAALGGTQGTWCPRAAGHSALSPRPIKAGPMGCEVGGDGGPQSSRSRLCPWTADRCWAAGPSRAASVLVLAETAKRMKTTSANSRP